MRVHAVTVMLAMLACSPAVADDVVLQTGLSYGDVRVVNVVDGSLVFELGGRAITKELQDIRSIRLDDQPAYNDAEVLLAGKQYLKAAERFAALGAGATDARVKSLLPWRQMHAWAMGGRIDRALALWLPLAERSASAAVLRSRPRKWGAKGSKANAEAMKLLTAGVAATRDNPVLAATLTAMLAELTALEAGKAVTPPSPPATRPDSGQPPTNGASSGATDRASRQLTYARELLGRERYSAAAEMLGENISSFSAAQLPEVLLLLGKARIGLSPIGDPDSKDRLMAAGLDLMRVWVYWPKSPQAPEALVLAAVVNARLGNPKAARLAYQRVVKDYPGTTWAKRAEADLAKLK